MEGLGVLDEEEEPWRRSRRRGTARWPARRRRRTRPSRAACARRPSPAPRRRRRRSSRRSCGPGGPGPGRRTGSAASDCSSPDRGSASSRRSSAEFRRGGGCHGNPVFDKSDRGAGRSVDIATGDCSCPTAEATVARTPATPRRSARRPAGPAGRPWPTSSWLLSRGYAVVSSLEARRRSLGSDRAAADGDPAFGLLRRRPRPSPGQPPPAAELAGRPLWIDGFNVLTTIESPLGGGVVIHCRDGTYRDIAGVHGTYRRVVETTPALRSARRADRGPGGPARSVGCSIAPSRTAGGSAPSCWRSLAKSGPRLVRRPGRQSRPASSRPRRSRSRRPTARSSTPARAGSTWPRDVIETSGEIDRVVDLTGD